MTVDLVALLEAERREADRRGDTARVDELTRWIIRLATNGDTPHGR